jgi:hypothetical protein
MFASPNTLIQHHHQTLGRHVAQCQRLSSLGARLRCWADAAHGVVAPRMFTTVVLLSLASAVTLALAGVGS